MSKKARCCDIVACRDQSACGCCLPTTTGDARRLKWMGVILGIVALVFLLIGLFVPTTIANQFEKALKNSAILEPNSPSLELMKSNEKFPMKLEVYMYNVTNPELAINGEKPKLKEIGPFIYWVYRDFLPGYNFSDDKTLFEYQYFERYQFDESLSVGKDDEIKIYTANMPFWGVASAFIKKDLGEMLDVYTTQVATNETYHKSYADPMNMAFSYRTVRETMFGYNDDPFMNCIADFMGAKTFSPIYTGIILNYTSVEDARLRLPTNETITTGYNDRSNTRHYVKYRGSSTIKDLEYTLCPWGKDDEDICQIRGIDGAATVPINKTMDTKDLAFDFWYPSLFRHVNFIHEKTYVEESIEFYRFRFNPTEWMTYTEHEPNTPYNITVGGVIPLGKALSNSPIATTRPRQLRISDPKFVESVEIEFLQDGKRDASDQWSMDTYFDFERRTGSTLRFQSTSEMVASIGPLTFEYDDWFVLLSLDQLYELEQLIDNANESLLFDSTSFTEQPQQQERTITKLYNLMQQFSTLNEEKLHALSTSTSSSSEPYQHRPLSIPMDDIQFDANNQRIYNNNINNSKPCGFAPGVPSCFENQAFNQLSLMMKENKLKQQQERFQLQQEMNNDNNNIETELNLGDKVVVLVPKLAVANLPVFWANQTGGINQHDLHALGQAFNAVDNTVKILPIICFLIALVLLFLGAFLMIRGSKYQSSIHRDAGTLHEIPQDGDLPDQQHNKQYGTTNNDGNYNDTLDALDLDPIYSNDYSQRNNGTASSSLHISQSGRQQNTGYNRSYSTTSSRKQMNRDRSFEPLSPQKGNGYGGIELKNNDQQY